MKLLQLHPPNLSKRSNSNKQWMAFAHVWQLQLKHVPLLLGILDTRCSHDRWVNAGLIWPLI